ncbi:hypothetical protein [Leptospira harrisiae]|uniref:Yip1 domain-containing protein n=1 Tax=Leptospira harrisiae TaxID=2023189 RepID=A0A2N0AM69_9LEPT|nr:hypothetical protein [Leptospira harrisiae]PJZ85380.1 hypothetical protein CH364_03825 [Leptospira harrisiae]PKA08916.1 hypothetical protein CH366_03965 [Leptospira harrisiae]
MNITQIGKRIKRYRDMIANTIKERILFIYHSPFFYFSIYLFLYGIHCFWNWDEFMSDNRNLEMEAITSGKQVSLWSLYPFQIFSVLFVSILYLSLSLCIHFLFSLIHRARETLRNNIGKLMISLFHEFFFFVCVLFLGNQFLGLFLASSFYSILVVMFWTALFLIFLIKSGELYKRLFVSRDHFVAFLSHSLGFVNPILFVFFVLALANV